MWKPETDIGHPLLVPTIVLWDSILLNLEFAILAKLTGHQALSILLSLPNSAGLQTLIATIGFYTAS